MEIPNYDIGDTTANFKQIYDFMPKQCFRMLIAGPSGSGKSNTLTHILLAPLLYYDHLYLYAKNMEQPKYQLLVERLEKIAKKIGVDLEDIFTAGDIIPVEELDNDLQKVVVFDDYVCDTNKDINNYFLQGRHKNCSVIYLTQSYYKTPRDIRLNCSHYIFFDFDKRERDLICNEHSMNKFVLENPYDFIYLDKPRKIIKRNFYGNI